MLKQKERLPRYHLRGREVNKMEIKNLTPHELTLVAEDGSILRKISPSGTIARAYQKDEPAGELDGFPLVRSSYGEPIDLPEYEEGVYLFVSLATAKAAQTAGRRTDDLLISSQQVRDENGNIVGCRGFAIL